MEALASAIAMSLASLGRSSSTGESCCVINYRGGRQWGRCRETSFRLENLTHNARERHREHPNSGQSSTSVAYRKMPEWRATSVICDERRLNLERRGQRVRRMLV